MAKGTGKRKVFMSKQKIGVDRVAKIKKNPSAHNAVFVYDKRTSTIRLQSQRTLVLSNRAGKGVKPGHFAVFRNINSAQNGQVQKNQKLTFSGSRIQNKAKGCLSVQGKNKEEAALQWWNCVGKPTQKWEKVFQLKKLPPANFNKMRFNIFLKMEKGRRNIFLSKERQGKNWVLKIVKKPNHWRSWFIMDKRTNSIRLFTQRHLALSQAGKAGKVGGLAVMRHFKKGDKAQQTNVNGHRIQIKDKKLCLSTLNHVNKDNINVVWWNCVGKPTQKWERKAIRDPYEDLCKDVSENGKRLRRCPGKKDKFLGEACKNQVEIRRGKEILVKKCGDKTWEIVTCKREKTKGVWYRKCGKNNVTKVASGAVSTKSK